MELWIIYTDVSHGKAGSRLDCLLINQTRRELKKSYDCVLVNPNMRLRSMHWKQQKILGESYTVRYNSKLLATLFDGTCEVKCESIKSYLDIIYVLVKQFTLLVIIKMPWAYNRHKDALTYLIGALAIKEPRLLLFDYKATLSIDLSLKEFKDMYLFSLVISAKLFQMFGVMTRNDK